MNILAIETSCDETAVAIVENGKTVRASVIASQIKMHTEYGGVVPEMASRSHIVEIVSLMDKALLQAKMEKTEIDAIAVTYAPGLIGALLVGVNFAKGISSALNIPLIPVHHVRGHIAANYLTHPALKPPFLCLCVSGGTTEIVDVKDHTTFQILGGTRDDAAGECFDKVARVLGIGYPGGAVLDKLSQTGDDTAFPLPIGKLDDAPLDMSFSGLKTAAINAIHRAQQKGEEIHIPNLAASMSKAVSDSLCPRVIQAAKQTGRTQIAVAGGVAANSRIRADLQRACEKQGLSLFLPDLALCGDNAAMIGCQGYYEFQAGNVASSSLNAFATRDISCAAPN